ncbi:arsenic transporter [Sphaerisporangium rufum]|uniref:Arsenic transporter n=1 Tax=Sphaerisporangium rufum TaxID=1381558 RepID=A0A919R206_9ACTN|nr:SLC13 family permease [Sphaerisporangium rufum]GII76936.1 arsenic transporter [Sphaerisporangium rufum]
MACVLRRLPILDRVRLGVLVAGLACVATGLLPAGEAVADVARIGPLLLFLTAIIVLAELTKEAQVFDVLAGRLAIVGRGRYAALFLLCVAFASFTTAFLNLDTTAVLLTPVMLALASRARIAPLPLAMTTVWPANTASLLLPVSNLTNLLAMDRVGLSTVDFAARMWAPQAAALAVTMALLWVFYWRRGARGEDRYVPPPAVPVADRVLFGVAAAACAVFIGAILAGVEIGVAAAVAAVPVVAAFAWRDRGKLAWSLIPWQLLAFVVGLFLIIPTLSRYGLDTVMRALIGDAAAAGAEYRAAAAGAGLSNLVGNLPAYYAGERVIAGPGHERLLSLLIGTNVGAVITPWASLATLLWFEWCRRREVRVPIGRFLLSGACLAVTGLAAAVAALLLTA